MKKIILVNKKEGGTPLMALESFRGRQIKNNKSYKDIKITYAGRLDPMASGLLLLLAGDEVKNKEKYLKLDKEYEFEILFGFATDTYDILGKVLPIPIRANGTMSRQELEQKIKQNLKYFKGKFIQKYPLYSSKTVNGKQLFEYGRGGVDVILPEREVFVKNIKFLKIRTISSKKLLENIQKRIKKVKGDFRQKEILKIWGRNLKNKKEVFFIGSFKIKCSSGTYVRGVADSLGEKLGTGAIAYFIKRTKIGKWSKIRE
ncbi:hypothetical protein HZA26_01970 [Candidatus Nomurabacteria bacterium]|nr:hypothetical protein [Candidatus Nomurabacteria bacterium]